jgi:hypothetical protein
VTVRHPANLVYLMSAAVATALLAGCGSSTGTTASSSGGGSQSSSAGSSSSSGSSSGTSVNDGIGHAVNVCSLIPAGTAASVSGEAITVATEQDTASYKIWSCNYTNADGTNGFEIDVLAEDAAAGYAADIQAAQTVGAPVTQISGLGDKAFSGTSQVEALFGNYEIKVANLASDAPCETLIKDLQPKI